MMNIEINNKKYKLDIDNAIKLGIVTELESEYSIAISPNGDKRYYRDGLIHREDGPAVELSDGYKIWCLNGKTLSESEWRKKISVINLNSKKINYKIYHTDGKPLSWW